MVGIGKVFKHIPLASLIIFYVVSANYDHYRCTVDDYWLSQVSMSFDSRLVYVVRMKLQVSLFPLEKTILTTYTILFRDSSEVLSCS
jgi:hypothetical protein